MKSNKVHSLCHTHLHRYVRVVLTNGVRYEGYIVRVDHQYVTIAVPHKEGQTREWENDERNPLALLTLPLFFLAGLAVRRPPYPYPAYYYPYPTPYPAPYPAPYPVPYPTNPSYPPYPTN